MKGNGRVLSRFGVGWDVSYFSGTGEVVVRPQAGSFVRTAKVTAIGTITFTGDILDDSGASLFSVMVYPIQHLGSNPLSVNVRPKCASGKEMSVVLDLDGKWKTTFPFDDTPLP